MPSNPPDLIPEPDRCSQDWVGRLSCHGHDQEIASAELRALLVRIARPEAGRRAAALEMFGPEVDDIADQAATDALLVILRKLDDFRGDSKFTTWAAKFVIFEVAGKINRHYWRRGETALQGWEWDRLPARFGMQPEDEAVWRDLMAALRVAVENDLSDRQRVVFLAIVVRGVPLDALSAELGTNRNALYKVLFDARHKLRAVLDAGGYLTATPESARLAGERR